MSSNSTEHQQQQSGTGMTTDFQDAPQYARRQMLANNEERQRLRANASLPANAWTELENAIYPAMDDVLTVYNDIRNMGLTLNVDIMNKAVEWQKRDFEAYATVSMDPEVQTEEGHTEFDLDGAPLPLIHSDFSTGFREDGGNMSGTSIETLNAEGSARVVAEAAEDLVLNGWEPSISGEDLGGVQNGYQMFGLTNHPSAHTGTLSDWTSNPGAVRGDLQAMARQMKDSEFRPGNNGYFTYIGSDLEDVLTEPDPSGSGDLMVIDRIEELNDIGTIRVADHLDSDAVLMFRPTRDVVDLAIGLEEQVVQWDTPWRDYFKTILGFTPRVKDTLRGQSGIAYHTGGTTA